ncbi:MAG: hypothetical protein ACTS3F_15155 [Phycisphaerales bacterium]
MTWNVTNYSSGRIDAFGTSIYAEFEGRSMSPDVFVGQEFLSQSGVNNFLAILNSAPGTPGDWAAAPFQNGADTDNAFFYRTSKIEFLGMTVVSQGSPAPNHPRDVNRYDIRPVGYASDEAVIAIYSSHMKAGSGSADQARRLVEAQEIRSDAESLNPAWNIMLGGDFNIQSSNQGAYQWMVGSQANNDGRLFDPIATPGSWNNNGSYRFVHTQDPAGAGGMDDRHDQLLICADLLDGQGLDYIGAFPIPYSTTTWDDPNHSYRSWGNDGTSFDQSLRIAGNTMVGAEIAQALVTTTNGQGHLPVFLDLRLPAAIAGPATINIGTIEVGTPVELAFEITHAGDTGLWGTNGLEALEYAMNASPGLDVPGGVFELPAGASLMHTLIVDTSEPGFVNGVIEIASNALDQPTLTIPVLGEIVEPTICPADLTRDGVVDSDDLGILLGAFGSGSAGDINGDSETDSDDLGILLSFFGTPC